MRSVQTIVIHKTKSTLCRNHSTNPKQFATKRNKTVQKMNNNQKIIPHLLVFQIQVKQKIAINPDYDTIEGTIHKKNKKQVKT